MKKFYLFLSAMLIINVSFGQSLRPVAQKVNEKKSLNVNFKKTQLFELTNSSMQRSVQLLNIVNGATVVDFRQSEAKAILRTKPENINFIIPTNSGTDIELELFRSNIFTPDFSVVTSGNNEKAVSYEGGVHYWGIIKGDNSSLAAISIFNDEVMGMISSPSEGNLVLGKLENDIQGRHILYNERNLMTLPTVHCFTTDDNVGYSERNLQTPSLRVTSNCIRLYWEVNFDVYQNKGSVANATNYVTGLFNQSAILYNNDNIPVSLSQVFVWNTTSPYTSTSTSGLLSQFQSNRNSFNGDLGNLLGYAGGGGVAAGFSGLCSSNLDNSQCYSGISSGYSNVPTYSWSVEVTTHEQGHLMGSRHTHACVWNGNNTAIDGCGPAAGYGYEGSCSGAPIPSGGGTIMSYCHLVSAGINFSLGFGTQPKNVILNNYNSAGCLASCGSNCGTPYQLAATAITVSSATVSWAGIAGATSYSLQYKPSSSGSWTTVNSVVTTSYNLTGLTDATSYDFQVLAVCASGSSSYSVPETFSTLAICADNYEPNNTGALATSIVLNTYTSGLITPKKDIDFFKFSNTVSLPNIQVTLTNLPAGYDMMLLKGSSVKGASQNGGLTNEIITYNTSITGLYKVKIYGPGGANNATACYTLKVQLSNTPFRLGFDNSATNDESKIDAVNENEISIYPNPANSLLTVQLPASENNSGKISIVDQMGREVAGFVLEKTSSINNVQFDISKFSNGIYFAKVIQGNNIITKKILVIH